MECYTLSLILIIFLRFTTFTKATNLVPDTCMKISKSDPKIINYDLCVKTFGSDPRSSKATLEGLAEISFNITASKAKSIASSINQLLKNPKFDPFAKEVLKTCLFLYSGAPDFLESGLEALKSKDFFKANTHVSAAMDCGPDCEDGFKEKRGEVSPLTKENSDYFVLGAISLAFTNLFK